MYIPVGYVPILTERKSGLLTPRLSDSSVDGITVGMTYFWAISRSYDATIGLDWIEERGLRSKTEFRYAPSKNTSGVVNFVFLDDNLSGDTFWKFDAIHKQHLPLGFKLNAKIDQTSKADYNKVFQDQTELRTRRSSDSYGQLVRTWDNNTFDVLARYQESEQSLLDSTFGILPKVTFQTQPLETGFLNMYFDQETSFTQFLFDLDTSINADIIETTQRFDFHPSLTLPINIAPWLQLTPQVGFRATWYDKQLTVSSAPVMVTVGDSFSREIADLNVVLEGPKFNRIFSSDDPKSSSIKHVVEPRLRYDYIPDWDREDRDKIRPVDEVDAIENTNKLGLFLVQRLLKKRLLGNNSSEIKEIARLELSQSYDFDEARRPAIVGTDRRPFSAFRFDLDSQVSDNFFLNTDFTFNFYTDTFETWNIDTGIKINKWLMFIVERREKFDEPTSTLGTLDITLPKGWNGKYSLRYDEFNDRLLEQNARLTYNDKCMCWGFTIDFIDRDLITNNIRTREEKIMFSISLKGLGEYDGSSGSSFIHRRF